MQLIYYSVIFLLGLSVGSFIHTCFWRASNKRKILTSCSRCDKCNKKLLRRDLIPIASYLMLRGKCRFCNTHIPAFYLAIEALTGLFFVYIAILHAPSYISFEILMGWFIVAVFIYIFLFDLVHKEIPVRLTILSAVVLFVLSIIFTDQGWMQMTLGALVCSGFFLIQYLLSSGKYIGGGDIILGLWIGVVVGWPAVMLTLFIAYVLGAFVSIILLVTKRLSRKSLIAFGPFLSVAALITLFWGSSIISWYIGLL